MVENHHHLLAAISILSCALKGSQPGTRVHPRVGAFAASLILGREYVPGLERASSPIVAIVLWGTLAAPKSQHRLPPRLRLPFEFSVFWTAGAALTTAGRPLAGAIFGALVAAHALMRVTLRRWD